MDKYKKLADAGLFILIVALFGIGLAPESKAVSVAEFNAGVLSSGTPNTTAINPFDGRGLVDGVIFSSSPGSNAYLEFRDSNTANTTSGIAWVISFPSAPAANLISPGTVLMFPRPLRIYRGLSVNASACASGTQQCFAVLYRQVDE